jgi:hypothetical protein
VPDEACQGVHVPARIPRLHHDEVRVRTAGLERGDAALGRAKEFACTAQRESKRLLRVVATAQLRGETVEKFVGGELALHWHHVASYQHCPDQCHRQVPEEREATLLADPLQDLHGDRLPRFLADRLTDLGLDRQHVGSVAERHE